jgi:hypothetical protein
MARLPALFKPNPDMKTASKRIHSGTKYAARRRKAACHSPGPGAAARRGIFTKPQYGALGIELDLGYAGFFVPLLLVFFGLRSGSAHTSLPSLFAEL